MHGSVRLRVLKPTRVTHIAVCLHGFVQVFKNPGSPGESVRPNNGYQGTGGGKKSGEYFGNGFASLFEDEVVLCGDGRLAEGSYQFNFELEFPDRDLPSSLDFERGTISYVVTATMTRPTTISPVTTCDRKVYFLEQVDIAHVDPPRSRTITYEAQTKRSRAKHQALKMVDHAERRSRKGDPTEQSERHRSSGSASTSSVLPEAGSPGSPAPSEFSFDSVLSSNGRTSQVGSQKHSPRASDSSKANASKTSIGNKAITAIVEPITGGCLRGENVGVKVQVTHTKPIRSLYGVIVTLYRQARVDMHPAIPLGPMEKGEASKYEDYYPKSLTGLGGLSLSGAGSSHLFRMDLAQVMVPLYVDPTTLAAEVTAKVRVPEEAFSTISTVPGRMIEFKYYVEAIVDIQGKLSGSDKSLGQHGILGAHPQLGAMTDGVNQPAGFAPYGSNILDTTPIRRDKSVLSCDFELVIGTKDSARPKGKRKVEAADEPEQQREVPEPQPEPRPQLEVAVQVQPGATDAHGRAQREGYWYDGQNAYHDTNWYQYYPDAYGQPSGYGYGYFDYQQPDYYEPPPAVPIPNMPDESQLSEKERVRRAEARLLPSQPPGAEVEQSDGAPQAATAPYLPEEDDLHLHAAPISGPSALLYGEVQASASATASAGPSTAPGMADTGRDASAVPSYQPPEPGSPSHRPTEDKQELERQRLHAQASAPPADNDEAGPSSSALPDNQPSAPTDEQADVPATDFFDSHADAAGSSGLPRYER